MQKMSTILWLKVLTLMFRTLTTKKAQEEGTSIQSLHSQE